MASGGVLVSNIKTRSMILKSDVCCESEKEWKACLQNKKEQLKLRTFLAQVSREERFQMKRFNTEMHMIRARSARILRGKSLPDLLNAASLDPIEKKRALSSAQAPPDRHIIRDSVLVGRNEPSKPNFLQTLADDQNWFSAKTADENEHTEQDHSSESCVLPKLIETPQNTFTKSNEGDPPYITAGVTHLKRPGSSLSDTSTTRGRLTEPVLARRIISSVRRISVIDPTVSQKTFPKSSSCHHIDVSDPLLTKRSHCWQVRSKSTRAPLVDQSKSIQEKVRDFIIAQSEFNSCHPIDKNGYMVEPRIVTGWAFEAPARKVTRKAPTDMMAHAMKKLGLTVADIAEASIVNQNLTPSVSCQDVTSSPANLGGSE